MITNNLSWQEIKPQGETFSPRFGHSLTCFDHNLYIYGGIDTISKKDDFYRIKVKENFQTENIPMTGIAPSIRFGFQCCIYESSLYLHGGNASMDGIYFNDLYKLELKKLQWIKIDAENNFPGRIHHTFTNYKQFGYIYGGIEGKNVLKDLLLFDFEKNQWSEVEQQQEKNVFGHSANIHEEHLICFGGCDGKKLLKELRIYDFKTKKWTFPNFKGKIEPLFRHSSNIYKNFLLIYGGMIDQENYNKKLYCFDLNNFSWCRIQFQGNEPVPRSFHQSIILDGNYYILGGYGGMLLNDVHCFNLPSNLSDFLTKDKNKEIIQSFDEGFAILF